jgi:transcriptional regulator with PAS, ATPase and Fis domain
MIKITAIAPYTEFADLFSQIFKKHNQNPYKPEYENEDYILEIIMSPGSIELEKTNFNTDVIVARGGIAYHLRIKEDIIPVVEIPVAGNDLIHSLYECKQRFNCKEVAVIGTTNMIIGAERLSNIIGINVVTVLSIDENEIEEKIKEVLRKGINTVIGGTKTINCAKELGANTVVLRSGEESIWQAITEAKRVAHISRREQERAQMYKTIIDYAYEGVIALDNKNIISVFNTSAQKALNIQNQNIIGENIKNILPKSDFRNILSNPKCLDEITKYNDAYLTVNMIPFVLKEEQAGKVLTFQDITEIQKAEGKIRQKIHSRGLIAKHNFNDIIGQSRRIKEVIQISKDFSVVDSNILLFGKTGTGKELFAQSIHNHSQRNKGPFVAVNCAALPENLLESELFGYVEGAFTGAIKGGKPGLFELAHRGTIFLDEIAEIPLKLQGQLLRVLQEKEIRRIGHDRVIPVDVRVITASNKDLNTLVQEGLFREDLYYRLNVLKIDLPSLRERKEDILILAESFIKKYLQLFDKMDINLTDKAKELLSNYSWPGNVRQLKNISERLVVLNKYNVIDEDDVKKALADRGSVCEFTASPLHDNTSSSQSYARDIENYNSNKLSYLDEIKQIEKRRIIDALDKAGFNKSKAARMLGIERNKLLRRMRELDIVDLSKHHEA